MMSSLNFSDELPYFSCIFARDSVNGGIGYKNSLPWKLKDDIAHFKKITTFNTESKENIVIMGRCTWEGLGKKLSNRINIVVSKTLKEDGVLAVPSLDEALQKASEFGKGRYIFVIGGVSLYKECFNHSRLETIYETRVSIPDVSYDTYFTENIPLSFEEVFSKVGVTNHNKSDRSFSNDEKNLKFVQYNRIKKTPEKAYFDLVNKIITDGEEREDRTGTGTISVFGPQVEFDISEFFPLLSTKTVGLKTVFEELIWMLRGQTNNNTLKRKKVHIWTKNSDDHHKKMLKIDSSHSDGDLGPLYGYQWRNFGVKYTPIFYDNNLDEKSKIEIEDKKHIGEGFDQIKWVINELKTNPDSRRILFSAWNPQDIEHMVLAPCHVLCQFYVSNKRYLHCKLYMRSNDVFLGAPFNIAQYSLLTYMIATMTGYVPGKLVYSLGDAHIYKNHIEQMKIQLLRPFRNLPRLQIIRVPENIEDFEYTDFKLLGGKYPHSSIKGDMAV